MQILPEHKIYNSECSLVSFISHSARSRYNGSSLLDLRAGGNEWYIYQPPIAGTDYNPETHKLNGTKRIEGVYVTEDTISIPEDELSQREISKIDAELSELDIKATRGSEDLVNDLVARGILQAIPPELSTTVAKKEELRAVRLALTDGIVTEQEAIDLGTTKAGFWAWLGGLFT